MYFFKSPPSGLFRIRLLCEYCTYLQPVINYNTAAPFRSYSHARVFTFDLSLLKYLYVYNKIVRLPNNMIGSLNISFLKRNKNILPIIGRTARNGVVYLFNGRYYYIVIYSRTRKSGVYNVI